MIAELSTCVPAEISQFVSEGLVRMTADLLADLRGVPHGSPAWAAALERADRARDELLADLQQRYGTHGLDVFIQAGEVWLDFLRTASDDVAGPRLPAA